MRIIYDHLMPKDMQKKIMARLNVDRLDAALASGRYQNHKDLMKFPDFGHEELKFPKWKHIMKKEFVAEESIMTQIRRKTAISTCHTIRSTDISDSSERLRCIPT